MNRPKRVQHASNLANLIQRMKSLKNQSQLMKMQLVLLKQAEVCCKDIGNTNLDSFKITTPIIDNIEYTADDIKQILGPIKFESTHKVINNQKSIVAVEKCKDNQEHIIYEECKDNREHIIQECINDMDGVRE
jgi:hypothetical protein